MDSNSNQVFSRQTAVLLGILGILGSIVLFAGDMLFYYNGDQIDFIANMGNVSPERIVLSGVSALIAAWLYTFASGQVYYAFQPAKKWIRVTVFVTFTMIMISYGVVHGAYVAIAVSAQNAVGMGMAPDAFTELAVTTNNAVRYITYLPFGIFTALFIPAVWLKKTYYPRWVIIFSPIILFLLSGAITGALDGKMKSIIGGGYLNLILLLFFSTATIGLWINNELK